MAMSQSYLEHASERGLYALGDNRILQVSAGDLKLFIERIRQSIEEKETYRLGDPCIFFEDVTEERKARKHDEEITFCQVSWTYDDIACAISERASDLLGADLSEAELRELTGECLDPLVEQTIEKVGLHLEEAQVERGWEVIKDALPADEDIIASARLREVAAHRDEYMLLSRLQAECNYFILLWTCDEDGLWAGSVEAQADKMRELWDGLPADGKPEWITPESIDEYETTMRRMLDEQRTYLSPGGLSDAARNAARSARAADSEVECEPTLRPHESKGR